MTAVLDLGETILDAWRTNNRTSIHLVENLPEELWGLKVPGEPRRTVRSIAGHLHNCRSRWLKTLGAENGIAVPEPIDLRKVTRSELMSALEGSGAGIEALLRLGIESGGRVPMTKAYVWRNLPLDVGHVLAYFVAHEGHHRGQIVLLARQLGHRLPAQVVNGLWQWNKRCKE